MWELCGITNNELKYVETSRHGSGWATVSETSLRNFVNSRKPSVNAAGFQVEIITERVPIQDRNAAS